MGRRAIKLIKPKRKYTRRVPELPKELPELPDRSTDLGLGVYDAETRTILWPDGRRTGSNLEPIVTMRLSLEQARHLQQGLADLMCWCRGYCAASRRDGFGDYDPMGISEARDLHIALKAAIEDHEKGNQHVAR